MNSKAYRSKCCNSEVRADGIPDFLGSSEVCTVHYVCLKCNNPCDVVETFNIPNKRDESILEWTKQNLPGFVEYVRLIYEWKFMRVLNPLRTLYLMLAIGFEAGRQFQHDNPTLEINDPDVYSDMDAYI
jgi:hypothetical protein